MTFMMPRLKLILILTYTSFVAGSFIPNWKSDNEEFVRKERSAASNKNCETWSPWVNKHTPTVSDKNDTDFMTRSELETFCPLSLGGTITKMQCVDDKGEPFSGVLEDKSHHYIIKCDNISAGVVCSVHDNSWDRHCPDLSVGYFCSCNIKQPITTKAPPTTVAPPSTTTRRAITTTTSGSPTFSYTVTAAIAPTAAPIAVTTHATTTTKATAPSTPVTSPAKTPRATAAAGMRVTSRPMTPTTKPPSTTSETMKETRTESSKGEDDGTMHIDSEFFFYSSIVTGGCLLVLIGSSCVITYLLCKRKNGKDDKEEDKKSTKVQPFDSQW